MKLHDLIKPNWKNSNPTVRLETVREMEATHFDILAEIAVNDEDAEVRLAAAAKIGDQNTLERVVTGDVDPDVRNVIVRKLDEIFLEHVVRSSDAAEAKSWVARISGEDALVRVVAEAAEEKVRIAALGRVNSESKLARLTEDNCGKTVGTAIVERVSHRELLNRIAKQASNKTVRRQAQEKCDALDLELTKPTLEEQCAAEQREMCEAAEKLCESWNWEFVQAQFGDMDKRWHDFDPPASRDLRTRYDAAHRRFDERWQEFHNRYAEDRTQAEERMRNLAARERLCERLEQLFGTEAATTNAACDELRTAWSHCPPLSGDDMDRLSQRFEEADQAFLAEHRRRIEIRDRETAKGVRLEELCRQAEAVAKSDEFDGMAAMLDSLENKWRQVEQPGDGASDLAARFRNAVDSAKAKYRELMESLARERDENRQRQESICSRVEALLNAEAIPAAEQEIRKLKKAFRVIGPVDAEQSRILEKRFRKACDQFYRNYRDRRQAQDLERWSSLTIKQDLCEKSEALADDDDLKRVAKTIKQTQARWKEIGPVPREHADDLWLRFKTVCDSQYARCKTFFDELDRAREHTLSEKETICRQAESLLSTYETPEALDRIKALQAEWKALGPVPRRDHGTINQRFHDVCQRFFNDRRSYFERLHAKRDENLKRKMALCDGAEATAESTDWKGTANDLKRMQADWKEIGPTDRQKEQPVWERFQKACNAFFERRDAHFVALDKEREDNLARRTAVCDQVASTVAGLAADNSNLAEICETLFELRLQYRQIGPTPKNQEREIDDRFVGQLDTFFKAHRRDLQTLGDIAGRCLELKEELGSAVEAIAESTEWRETSQRIKDLKADWKTIGSGPADGEAAAQQRFDSACEHFLERWAEHQRDMDASRSANLKRKEELCVRLEALADVDSSQSGGKGFKTISLADELRLAMESNFITSSAADERSAWHASFDEVKKIQADWEAIGAAAREAENEIWKRFRRAADRFYVRRPDAQRPRETPKEMEANRAAKDRLCEDAEALVAKGDHVAHVREAKRLAGRWKKIGRVPSKKDADALSDRFYTAVDKIFDAARAAEQADRR